MHQLRTWFFICAGALCFLAASSTTQAQDGSSSDSSVSQEVLDRRKLLQGFADGSLDIAPVLPEGSPSMPLNEETLEQYQKSLTAYYAYFEKGYAFRQGVFQWQEFSTRVIFWMVIGLVLLGMYFAAIQFHAGLFDRKTSKNAKDQAEKEKSEFDRGRRSDSDAKKDDSVAGSFAGLKSDVEISMQGVKVSSPVLGVVILVVSLAFFYLYLIYVYPVQDSF